MLRKFNLEDKHEYIEMMKEFYKSPAVLHTIPQEYMETTFDNIINGTPYAKGYIIEDDNNNTAGYLLLSITYSNEVAGLVVLVEELFIKEQFRGNGIGRKVLTQVREMYKDAKRFRLEVTKENLGAIKLYKNLGYESLDYLQMVIEV